MRVKLDINGRDYYEYFCENSKHELDYSEYRSILISLNEQLRDIILNGGALSMTNCGKIYIEERPAKSMFMNDKLPKHKAINYKATKELRKKKQPTWTDEDWKKIPAEERPFVLLDNSHTNGKTYKIKWVRSTLHPKQALYKFSAHRILSRTLAAILKDTTSKIIYYAKQ